MARRLDRPADPSSTFSPKWRGLGQGVAASSACTGRRTAKVEPRPTSLVTWKRPPMASTSRLQMARPSPVPPNLRVVDWSAWLKAPNTLPILSLGMPTPVSWMLMRTEVFVSGST